LNKRKSLQKLFVVTLLLIISFSIASSKISLVQADPGGYGKYLTIKFAGVPEGATYNSFIVTATKKSGHSWIFNPPDQEWKLGAGDVSLTATYPEGYKLLSWQDISDPDNPTTIGEENPIIIKSEKYATILVTFVPEIVNLTVNFAGSGTGTVYDGVDYHTTSFETEYAYGTQVTLTADENDDSNFDGWSDYLTSSDHTLMITLTEDTRVTASFSLKTWILDIDIFGEGSVTVTPSYDFYTDGEEAFLTFDAGDGYHLSSIEDNGLFADLEGTVFTTIYPITFHENHEVTVTFSNDGIAEVPIGEQVTVFLSSGASLTFDEVQSSGIALGTDLTSLFYDEFLIWAIRTTVSSDNVLIILQYDESILNSLGIDENSVIGIERADFVGDVNGDGVVNGQDVSIVANANPSAPGDPNWNTFLDLTGDGLINDEDVNLVNDHIGDNLDDASWYLLDGIGEDGQIRVNTDLNLVFGFTDHFSIFRGR
jgi:hypothetical protein